MSNKRIKELQAQIESEQKKISNCKHEFYEPYSNPETVREGYGMKTVGHGSDVWSEYEGYRDVSKPRWTRVCQHCGKEEHAYTLKVVSVKHEPDFGNGK